MRLIDDMERPLVNGLPGGRIEVIGAFADLCVGLPQNELLKLLDTDPAFRFIANGRYVAFQRIHTQLRYYAGKVDPHAPDHDEDNEIGVFTKVADAVAFAHLYVAGKAPSEIATPRHKGLR
jgi:hypothetical protein